MEELRKIEAHDGAALLRQSDETLAALSALVGQPIVIGRAPLIGRYGRIGTRRIPAEHEPSHKDLRIAYEWVESGDDAGRLACIYIGARHTGPLLQWRGGMWRNVYGHGDHGENGAFGGTWSASSTRAYPTIAAALEERDYYVGGIKMHRSELIEGPALLRALDEIAIQEFGEDEPAGQHYGESIADDRVEIV